LGVDPRYVRFGEGCVHACCFRARGGSRGGLIFTPSHPAAASHGQPPAVTGSHGQSRAVTGSHGSRRTGTAGPGLARPGTDRPRPATASHGRTRGCPWHPQPHSRIYHRRGYIYHRRIVMYHHTSPHNTTRPATGSHGQPRPGTASNGQSRAVTGCHGQPRQPTDGHGQATASYRHIPPQLSPHIATYSAT